MKNKPLKSWRTLAGESKARRKPVLSPSQIEKTNKVFEEIEKEQSQPASPRKIARQPEA